MFKNIKQKKTYLHFTKIKKTTTQVYTSLSKLFRATTWALFQRTRFDKREHEICNCLYLKAKQFFPDSSFQILNFQRII